MDRHHRVLDGYMEGFPSKYSVRATQALYPSVIILELKRFFAHPIDNRHQILFTKQELREHFAAIEKAVSGHSGQVILHQHPTDDCDEASKFQQQVMRPSTSEDRGNISGPHYLPLDTCEALKSYLVKNNEISDIDSYKKIVLMATHINVIEEAMLDQIFEATYAGSVSGRWFLRQLRGEPFAESDLMKDYEDLIEETEGFVLAVGKKLLEDLDRDHAQQADIDRIQNAVQYLYDVGTQALDDQLDDLIDDLPENHNWAESKTIAWIINWMQPGFNKLLGALDPVAIATYYRSQAKGVYRREVVVEPPVCSYAERIMDVANDLTAERFLSWVADVRTRRGRVQVPREQVPREQIPRERGGHGPGGQGQGRGGQEHGGRGQGRGGQGRGGRGRGGRGGRGRGGRGRGA